MTDEGDAEDALPDFDADEWGAEEDDVDEVETEEIDFEEELERLDKPDSEVESDSND